MNSHILIEKNNNILDIKFNRPESRNAITRDMFEQMLNTLEECKEDNELRAIFLSGEGDAFSAGGDVKDMADFAMYRLMDIERSLKYKHYDAAMVTVKKTIRELDRAR